MTRFASIAAASILAVLAPVATLSAQAASAEFDEAEFERALSTYRVISGALQDKSLKPEERAALFACIYDKSFKEIGNRVGQLIDEAEGLSMNNPAHVFVATQKACNLYLGGAAAKPAGPQAPESAR